MRIRHRLRIDREHYRSVFASPGKYGDKRKDSSGYCDFQKKLIILCPSIRPKRRLLWWTYWHEILEAINYEYGLGLRHDSQLDRLGRALAYFCEDNGLDFPPEATRQWSAKRSARRSSPSKSRARRPS